MASERPGAVIYARLSEDKTGKALAVARQEAECRQLAERLGFTVTAVYVDNSFSATSGVVRPDFERMLADKPPAIIAWHQDRLLRKGADLERVIALDVPIYTVTSGLLDLSNPAGRAVARTVAAWSQFEGEQKSERQQAKNRQLVESGFPIPGKRRFGYLPGNREAHPVEAPEVEALFDAFLSGASIRSLAMARGWRPLRVRETLSNAAYAGVLTHRGSTYEANAEVDRLIDRDRYDRVQALLAAPGRKVSPGADRKHLLSGIALCGIEGCGRTLNVTAGGYRCSESSAHVYIKGTDRLEFAAIMGLYETLLTRTREAGSTPDADRVRALRGEIDVLTADRARLSALAADPDFDADALRPRLREIATEIRRLEGEASQAEAASVELRMLADLRSRVKVEVQSARTLHPSRMMTVTPEDQSEALDALMDARAAFIDTFDALTLEDRRALIAGTVTVTLHPGRSDERIEVLPRQ